MQYDACCWLNASPESFPCTVTWPVVKSGAVCQFWPSLFVVWHMLVSLIWPATATSSTFVVDASPGCGYHHLLWAMAGGKVISTASCRKLAPNVMSFQRHELTCPMSRGISIGRHLPVLVALGLIDFLHKSQFCQSCLCLRYRHLVKYMFLRLLCTLLHCFVLFLYFFCIVTLDIVVSCPLFCPVNSCLFIIIFMSYLQLNNCCSCFSPHLLYYSWLLELS